MELGGHPEYIRIDPERCTHCVRCMQACPSHIFELHEQETRVREGSSQDCIRCGQCMAACADDAIRIDGLDPQAFAPLPEDTLDADALEAFFLHRRSIRNYQKRAVPRELVERAIAMGATAPMSFPPWLVEITTILGRKKIEPIAALIATKIEKMCDMTHHLISRFFVKRAIGKERYRFMNDFFVPLMEGGLELFHKEHVDVILRHAPALMVFHAPPIAFEGHTDSVIAACHTALALQALGLGVCFNGLVTGAAEMEKRAVNGALGVPEDNTIYAAFTFGYPRVKYKNSVARQFRSVSFVE